MTVTLKAVKARMISFKYILVIIQQIYHVLKSLGH